jgi:hypothetical protein
MPPVLWSTACLMLARVLAIAALVMISSVPAWAQKTDLVTLRNGDHFTCEIKDLQRGRLRISTDDAGTIDIEWDKVARVQAKGLFEVITQDGERLLGPLRATVDFILEVLEAGGPQTLRMSEITGIVPIGARFWARLDGSFDFGFNYTRSSKIAQLNLNSSTEYRRPSFEVQLKGSGTITDNGDGSGRDDRGNLSLAYVRFIGQRVIFASTGSFESNESLGLILRSQISGVVGRRLVSSNRALVAAGGGLSVNNEKAIDVASTQNLEGLLSFKASYYTYDRPKTTIDASVDYYPGLTDWGRHRLQIDASLRRELLKDFFLSLSTFYTFDSRPSNASAAHGDVGFVTSIGWSY